MSRRVTLCGLAAAATVALAGCATTAQPAQTTPAYTAAPPPASTTPATPSQTPVDAATLKRDAFRTCSQATPDDLRTRYNSPTSNPVDIANAYARTFPTSERVPVAEGCFDAITGQSGSSGTP